MDRSGSCTGERCNHVSILLFAGKLDFNKLPWTLDTLLFRVTVALGILPKGDHRDWMAVHTWAESLRPLLGN